jgi:hypothetical protein
LLPLLTLLVPLAAAEPQVELLTIGPGSDLFSQAGHASLCVVDGPLGKARCTSYGQTDFSRPVRLMWRYARGQAEFFAGAHSWSYVLEHTGERADRTIWRQTLPIEPEAARELAVALATDVQPQNRAYAYHHFRSNCTTRVRDHIDKATGGALRARSDQPWPATWREMTRSTLAGQPVWLAPVELAGRSADAHPSTWEAMAVPAILREQVRERLGSEPVLLHERKAPLPRGPTWVGRLEWVAIAGFVAALSAKRSLGSFVVGLLGLAVVACALISTHDEVRWNEILLVWWPTDVLLPWLSAPRLRTYATIRAVGLGVVAVASLAGLLVQPLFAPMLVAALPLLVAWTRQGEL